MKWWRSIKPPCVSVWLRRLIVLATSSDSQQGLGDFPHRCRVLVPATNIPVASFHNVGFVAALPVKHLSMEVAFAVVFAL
jgi:hypothetical protein